MKNKTGIQDCQGLPLQESIETSNFRAELYVAIKKQIGQSYLNYSHMLIKKTQMALIHSFSLIMVAVYPLKSNLW